MRNDGIHGLTQFTHVRLVDIAIGRSGNWIRTQPDASFAPEPQSVEVKGDGFTVGEAFTVPWALEPLRITRNAHPISVGRRPGREVPLVPESEFTALRRALSEAFSTPRRPNVFRLLA